MSLSALDIVSSTLGWGGTLQRPYQVARYSNGAWDTWPVSNSVLAIAMIGPDEGWIGTTTNIYHYTSAGGLIAGTTPAGGGVRSLSMLDANHGWAYDYYGGVFTYTNGSWAKVTPVLTLTASLRVIGISSNEAWLAGYSRDPTQEEIPAVPELYHFASGTWTSVPMPNWFAFSDISKVSATEWWATGRLQTLEYAFLHYKDGVFTTVPAAGEDVRAVSMLPDGTGFASGAGSLLWLYSYPYNIYLPLIRR